MFVHLKGVLGHPNMPVLTKDCFLHLVYIWGHMSLHSEQYTQE